MKKFIVILILIQVVTGFTNGFAIVRYVTPSGAGSKDGSSWANAYDNTQLQTAINEQDVDQVWVAAGTYKPTTGSDRTISFNMKNGVAIYGGFAGTETLLGQRNWTTNLTVLSGDIGIPDDRSDNTYSVVMTSGLDNSARLDGFSIKDGNSNTYGGGVYNDSSSPTYANLIISGNSADDNGGGGMYNFDQSSPVVSNCIFSSNTAAAGGGIMNQGNQCRPVVSNCIFVSNTATYYGGGIFNLGSVPTFTNTTVAGNSAYFGGGIDNSFATAVFNNSVIWGNNATAGKQIVSENYTYIALNYCCYPNGPNDNVLRIQGRIVSDSHCITIDPKFVNEAGNDYRLQGNSHCIDAGSNNFVASIVDVRGQARIQNTFVDMGAYEWTSGIDPDGGISWNGSVNTDWFNSLNWSSGIIPTAYDFVVIPNVAKKPVINDVSNTAVSKRMVVDAGSIVTIGSQGSLTVTDKLTNNAGITGLLIKSDISGTGSLKILGSVSGQATVQRWLAPDAWHLVSSPTSSQPIVDFMNENTDIATTTATAPFTFAMRDYNIAGTGWADAYFTDSKPVADLFGTGKGYVLLTKSPVTLPLVFKGDINSLPVNKATVKTGWNLIGNPFTSAISINSAAGIASGGTNFIDANPDALTGSYAAVYVWDETATPKEYQVVNHTYNEGAPFYAQVGQGFFVKSAVAGNLNFTSSMQAHQGTALFKAAKTPMSEIKLIAASSAGSVATVIKFIEGTTAGLDVGYDAGVFKADPSFSLYTKLVEDNGVDFQLQCLPNNQYGSLVIPVGLDSKAGGEIVFSVKTIQLDPNCKVILEDMLTNTFTDLSKGNYKALVVANTSVSNRFYLHTSDVISGVGNQKLPDAKLSAYAVRNVEIRVIGEVGNDAIATLYNGLGKVVLSKKLDEGNLNIIGLPNLSSGLYLLSIEDKGMTQTIKVLIRK